MKEFQYTIQDKLGLHARPAGLVVKEANQYTSEIIIRKGEKSTSATQLMRLMAMSIKKGDTITVSAEGKDEEAAIRGMQDLFSKYL